MRIVYAVLPMLMFLVVGCTGPMLYRQAKLPDGSEIRAYRASALVSPSVTIVAHRAAGSTNWCVTNTFSGPGLIPGASTGGGIAAAGALLRPDRTRSTGGSASASGGESSVENNIQIADDPPAPPKGGKPPWGNGRGKGPKG